MAAPINAQALSAVFAGLLAAHGRQHWWPHQDPDHPRFEILIGAVLTQHTAWTNVERAIAALRATAPLTADALLARDDLADLIRQAGPHRVKAERLRALCRWFIERGGFSGLERLETDTLCAELRTIRGIGPETADVIALYAFGRPRFVADAYAFRLLERLGWWQGNRRYEALRRQVENALPRHDAGFFDECHALIVAHAKASCHKNRPACTACVLDSVCPKIGVMPQPTADG